MNPSTPPPPSVVAYIRGSTDEQQNTLVAQQQQIEAYCTYRTLHLAGCFIDSGTSGSVPFFERPKVAEMMTFMEEHACTAFVITKLDRGFRNALDCLFTVETLKARTIDLHILELQLDTTTAIGRMVLGMFAQLAQFENERRSERQRDAFAVMKQSHHLCGTVPYGWLAVPSTRLSRTKKPAHDLIPHPEEQPVLAWIIDQRSRGVSYNEIARQLNARGVQTKRGKTWHGATVESVHTHGQLAAAA